VAAATAVDVYWRREDAQPPAGPALIVVIDVLRATSTITTALAAGAASVMAVDGPAEALLLRASDPARLLAGERAAHPLPGFDFGNSPAAMLTPAVSGRQVVLATTNGSRALAWAARQAEDVLALSLLNVSAVAAAVVAAAPEALYILCAGTEGRFSLDDAYVAGALLDALEAVGQAGTEWTDAARAALWTYRGAPERPFAALAATGPGRSLIGKGYRADVEFCAQRDAFAVVPRLRAGVLVAERPPG